MRKKDIKIGEEYAVYGLARGDEYRGQRVRVIKKGVRRKTAGGTTRNDVVLVEMLNKETGEPEVTPRRFKTIRWMQGVGFWTTSCEVQMPWAQHASQLALQQERRRKADERKVDDMAQACRLVEVLKRCGIEATFTTFGVVKVSVGFDDNIEKLADLVESYL